jgi:putative molybdopterin biosynthesis protein
MLAEQAREAGWEARCLPIEPDDPERITAVAKRAAGECDLLIIIAGSSAGRDDYTARVVSSAGTLAVHGVAVRPGHPVVLGTIGQTPVLGAPGYPVSASLTFDIFAVPLLAELSGTTPRARPRATARLARKLASPLGMDDWVRIRLGVVGSGAPAGSGGSGGSGAAGSGASGASDAAGSGASGGAGNSGGADGGTLVATPLPRGAGVLTSLVRADGLLVVPAGVEGYHAGSSVAVELLRGLDEIARTIVAIGSHDMVLDLASSFLRSRDPLVTLASSNVGSLGGLVALRDGLCHIAGSHLLDPATGEYTLPYIERVFGPSRAPGVAVVRLVDRSQGLIVAPGNPLGISGLADVCRGSGDPASGAANSGSGGNSGAPDGSGSPDGSGGPDGSGSPDGSGDPDGSGGSGDRVRYVNRQRGAGTRVLLDVMLRDLGLSPDSVDGYAREEPTHLAVAAAIASGRADAGMGIMAAAKPFGLDFIPLATEPYDLVVAPGAFASPQLAPLWSLLESDRFKSAVEDLGGYSAKDMGRRIR